jgi:hypothetical protein
LTRDDTNVLCDLYHYDQEKLVAAEINRGQHLNKPIRGELSTSEL